MFAPPSVSVDEPFITTPPGPDTAPDSVRLCVPPTVAVAFNATAFDRFTAEVVSIVVGAATVTAPVPSAPPLPSATVPPASVVPPE